jgi:hypothetical protein
VAGNDDGASTSRSSLHDLVESLKTLAVVCGAELVCKVVCPDSTEVNGRVRWENILVE